MCNIIQDKTANFCIKFFMYAFINLGSDQDVNELNKITIMHTEISNRSITVNSDYKLKLF